MRKARDKLDRDVALTRFRQHLARSRTILEEHAQMAMAEAGGKVRRAATILSQRLKADATFQVEVEALDRLMNHAFPDWPSPPPSENPNRRNRKARKTHAQKN